MCYMTCLMLDLQLKQCWSSVSSKIWVIQFYTACRLQFAYNCKYTVHPCYSLKLCKAIESQLVTERKAACWEACGWGGNRLLWERGNLSALMYDCVRDVCIQTCTEYRYLHWCASTVDRVYRTSVWNRTAVERVTLVPVALSAVAVVLGNLQLSLKPNKRHLQPHSKGRGVGTDHILCKVLRWQE
jgi:hypothetical protein